MDNQKSFAVRIWHNFDPSKFGYLWAKYVRSGNLQNHCARCMNGSWSRKFSGCNNPDLLTQTELLMDEVDVQKYKAIYFCGGSKKGYAHNVHFVVIPQDGATSRWDFEDWHVDIENGILSPIPAEAELDDRFLHEPYNEHFYTCRNFRWMVGFFYPGLLKTNNHD